MTTAPFSPEMRALLVHPDVEDICVDGTSPVMVRTTGGRFLPAAPLTPTPGVTDRGGLE